MIDGTVRKSEQQQTDRQRHQTDPTFIKASHHLQQT